MTTKVASIDHPSVDVTAAEKFGKELTAMRLHKGLSLRRLARMVGMTAHSGLVDYERGIRIPPQDLLGALVKALTPGTERLVALHRAATAERARARLAAPVGTSPHGLLNQAPACVCGSTVAAVADALEQLAVTLRSAGGKPRAAELPSEAISG